MVARLEFRQPPRPGKFNLLLSNSLFLFEALPQRVGGFDFPFELLKSCDFGSGG